MNMKEKLVEVFENMTTYEYPEFICGYDNENYYKPILLEIDKYGEKVRLWSEV